MRNEILAPKVPFLHCCAMSNSLPRKRLEGKELQALGLDSSELSYLCASWLKQLIICPSRFHCGCGSAPCSEDSTAFSFWGHSSPWTLLIK